MSLIKAGSVPAKNRPIAANSPSGKRIAPGSADKKTWIFSFRYWKQIEYFGLEHSTPSWFISVLEKLQELSSKFVDDFLTNGAERDTWRYHEINWGQKNIPIQRDALTWVDPVYRDNAEEYPLFQFQITQSLGRVVGFWDENQSFNIVLLDPLHNIQPSKSYGYKVDPCSPLSCDYTILLDQVEMIATSCGSQDCAQAKHIKALHTQKKELEKFHVLMMRFPDNGSLNKAEPLIQSGMSPADIFECGVDYLLK